MVDQLSHMPKIRQLLKLYGVRAVKQLSQNFILDPQLSSKMRVFICKKKGLFLD